MTVWRSLSNAMKVFTRGESRSRSAPRFPGSMKRAGVRVSFTSGMKLRNTKFMCCTSSAPAAMNCSAIIPAGTCPLTRRPRLVCLRDNHGHQLRLDRAVDLDLHVAEAGVVVNALASLLGRGGQYLDRPLKWSGAINESRGDDAWANLRSLRNVGPQRREQVDGIPQITRRGHTGGDVEVGVQGKQVGVHVPQAGQEHFAAAVDHFGSG